MTKDNITDVPILDCHQHLILPDRFPYSWTAGIPALAGKAFTYEDYLTITKAAGSVRAIFMETSPDDPHHVAESRLVMELADRPGSIIDGLILTARPEEEGFDAYIESVQHPKLVGFRRILHTMPDDVSQQPRFVSNIRKLEKVKLTFDLCMLARQLPLAWKLASQCPHVQFILDHCGIPEVAAYPAHFRKWREDILALAKLPNVACKISGVLAYCDPNHADIDAVRPFVEHCIEAFGFDRVVWGSDWPVVCMTAGLASWIDISRQLVRNESSDHQHQLFHRNAERIYLRP